MDTPGEINVLAELEHLGIAFTWASEEEVKCKCPFHDDTSPSCHVNVNKRVFKCHVAGCEASGDIIDLIARTMSVVRVIALAELAKRYDFDTEKIVDSDTIERWHVAIWQAFPLLAALRQRGVHDGLIRKYRWGENEGRVMIPVQNSSGHFVNVRKYLPGAPGAQKMRNMRGRSQPRWYPVEQLKYDRIMICGGEAKAIVAAEKLNPYGIGAITPTVGEQSLPMDLVELLKNKTVYHCTDVDEAGVTATALRCAQTYGVTTETYACSLPLDVDKYPKGDINDFVATENGDLLAVIDAARRWVPAKKLLDNEVPHEVELHQAVHADLACHRVHVFGVVSAMSGSPYAVPKDTRVICDRSQAACALCPIYVSRSDMHTIPSESSAILEMIDCSKKSMREAMMNGLGIPRLCRVVDFEPLTYYNAEDVRIAPQLEMTNRSADRIMQPAICVGDGMELNEAYDLVGRMYPHPQTQQSTLLISAYRPTQDALATYDKNVSGQDLTKFRPTEWTDEGLAAKLGDIYEDFEANVTRIFKRRDLHLVVDLMYHSPLFFTFDGYVAKGWVDALIMGDSSCGKSEVACGARGDAGLMTHYGLGQKVECKNASVAGLVGGMQNLNGKFFVTWGVIPTHDQRAVILEEAKGANVEVLGKLTDMRSSGIAELAKIGGRRTHARTRLLWLSNPRSDRKMSTYNFGIEAVKELMGNPEDVRRFDVALIVSDTEIDASEMNVLRSSRPFVEHRYTTELCRSLILWAWTRMAEQVVLDQEVTSLTLELATRLCEQFSDVIPLVDRGSMRLKLARLATSLACRTYSSDEATGDSVIVRPCHVRYAYAFLDRVYSGPIAGYRDFTEAVKIQATLLDPDVVRKYITAMPHPKDFIKSVLHTNGIDSQDIRDWCAWDRQAADEAMSFFVRKHALVRHGRTYYKGPQFIALLKGMLDDPTLKDRPNHVTTKEDY